MDDRVRATVLTALMCAVGACSRAADEQAMRIEIRWDADVSAACFMLRVTPDGRDPFESQPMVPGTRTRLTVGILRNELPATLTVQAIGYSDSECTRASVPAETSPTETIGFRPDLVRVLLQVQRESVLDGGTDAGGEDGGDDDAGVDAGFDGGANPGSDAGLDAGTESCANRVDDNGNGLVDCADPACGAGSNCNDGDLCTATDKCAAGVCAGTANTCPGQATACMVPTGCDAGVCLGIPTPARTFCDGGQCDGAGRCSPFCDPSKTTLAACYRFENNLVDGSRNRNDGTRIDGSFDAGSRGAGYHPGAAAIAVGDDSSLDCASALTLEAWVRLDAFPAPGTRFGIVDNDAQYGMYIGPGGELRCGSGLSSSVLAAVQLGGWHHLACVFDPIGLRSFVDGVQVSSMLGVGVLGNQGNPFGLHLGENSPSGDVLQGTLDGVRIWCEARAPLDLCTSFGQCG